MATDTVVVDPAASGLGTLTPEIFDGSEGKWLEWRFVFEAYQSRLGGVDAITLLAHAAAHLTPLHMVTLNDEARQFGYKLFGDLALLTRGTASRVVRSVETGNGLGAWQALAQRYQGGGAMQQKGVLQHSLYFNWKGPSVDWQGRYMQWKELMAQYDNLVEPGDQLAAAVRVAIVIEGSRHASQQLKDQLFVNVERFDTFLKLDEHICAYFHQLAAYTPAASKSRTPGDMEVDAFGKGPKGGKGKGDKGNGGKQGNEGKGYGNNAYGGGGFPGGGKKRDKGGNQGKGGKSGGNPYGKQAGAKGNQNQNSVDFNGYCGGCGIWGHKYRFCP